jgi:hypothetical protein
MIETKKEQEYFKLIKTDKHQIFILTCPAMIPFSLFASHYWIVANNKGKIKRYELRHFKNKDETYLFIDNLPPFKGVQKFSKLNFFWKSKIINTIEDENAHKLITFLENEIRTYPYLKKYFLLGPNSNTYIQWILDHFPELNMKLSRRAIGKNYKVKK